MAASPHLVLLAALRIPATLLLFVSLLSPSALAQPATSNSPSTRLPAGLPASLPAYRPAHPLSGILRIGGSPQMSDLLELYERGFHRFHPGVRFENALSTTLDAAPAVASGRTDIGLLGREIWPSEQQAFLSATGHSPLLLQVAIGSWDVPKATYALMVFVHRSNPIASLSTAQLALIFSQTSTRPPLSTWGELGLHGPWAHRSLHLYGFDTSNDKSRIFSRLIFPPELDPGARWSSSLHTFANSTGASPLDAGQAILDALAHDPDGIAISNLHYASPSVRALPISSSPHSPAIPPTRQNVASGRYPLSRAVFFVLDPATLSPLLREFVLYVLSRPGARDVLREGNYLPLTPALAHAQLALLASPPAP